MDIKDLKNISQVKVIKGQQFAGTLLRNANGAAFEYDQNYLDTAKGEPTLAVAFTLPLSAKRHNCAGYNLHPFFAGLLPEGLRLEAIMSQVKSSKDDLFTILLASSADTVGDVWVSETGQLPEKPKKISALEDIVFEQLFKEIVYSKSAAVKLQDLTIPGVQNKISARMISFPVKIKSRHHDYILKLSPKELPLLVENEYFFMNMAGECGLKTAPVKIVRDKAKRSGLLVERFDRVYDKASKSFVRIHQEDGCQFLNRYPADKYRLSLGEIAAGIAELSSAPLIELLELLRLTAFSYVIGNGDLHAKNISLITGVDGGRIMLSPAYDLLSTIPYGDLRMAIKLEGRDDNIRRSDFVSLGRRFGLRARVIEEMLDDLAERCRSWIVRIGEIGFDKKKTAQLQKIITKRIEEV